MGHTTVRIDDDTHATLKELARAEKRSMQSLLEEAVEVLRRRRFLEGVNAAYGALRADKKAWAELEQERRAWDATLADGLTVAEPQTRYRGRRRRGSQR